MFSCIKIQGKERTIMGTSNGNLWIAEDDGINFVEKKLPWTNKDLSPTTKEPKDTLSFGNLYSAAYNGNILTLGADINHLFYSFDRGDTWFVNNYIQKDLVVKYLNDENSEVTLNSLDFRGIAYGNNTWVAAASKSVIITATDITGKWEYQNCRTAFPDVPVGLQGRCNMFFQGLFFAKGYFVVYGASQADSTQTVAFYSKDAKVWKLIKGLPQHSSPASMIFKNGKFYAAINRVGVLLYTEDITSGQWEMIPQISFEISQVTFVNISMDIDNKNTLLIGGRDDQIYVALENKSFQQCHEQINISSGYIPVTCSEFNTGNLGSITSISYNNNNNGTWRIGTANGYLFYNIGSNFQELAHKRYGFDPINVIFSY